MARPEDGENHDDEGDRRKMQGERGDGDGGKGVER